MKMQEKLNEFLSSQNLKKLEYKNIKAILLVIYIILFTAIFYHITYAKRIIPGVVVSGIKLGGMPFSKAFKTLEENEKNIVKELNLVYENKMYTIKSTDIGLEYDWENSVVNAFEIGRSGNFFIDTKNKIFGLFSKIVTPASYDFDNDSLGVKLSIIKSELNVEPQQSKIVLKEGGLSIEPSFPGKKIDDQGLYDKVIFSISNLDYSQKEIPVNIVDPEIYEDDLKIFLNKVEGITSQNLVLVFEEKKWELGAQEILNLIAFEKEDNRVNMILDEFSFGVLSDDLSLQINKFPRGKVVSTNEKKVTAFIIVGEGKELDVDNFKQNISDSIFNSRRQVTLTVNTVTDINDKKKYGITESIGEGTSKFEGSIPSRVHNLTLAAENTSGVLVPPGAVYSMNENVGPIDYQHGFQSAYIIKGGRTVLGEGGGVCQTSTTLFRAVLNSGLPILARYPHAYRVGYYEQDMPVGFDAAIFQPSWDFKFKNDTNAYVLVQAYPDPENYSLTFKIFGTSDGRTVEISEPVISGQLPPPAPLYEDDPELPKGVVRQVDYSAWGATSSFTRTVKKGGEVLFTDTYTSKYQPWRAIFRVGTKEN